MKNFKEVRDSIKKSVWSPASIAKIIGNKFNQRVGVSGSGPASLAVTLRLTKLWLNYE